MVSLYGLRERPGLLGRKLRTDATVVGTNIAHPRNSALLSDGIRVLSRLLGKAKRVLEGTRRADP
jgi:hypothetical protein